MITAPLAERTAQNSSTGRDRPLTTGAADDGRRDEAGARPAPQPRLGPVAIKGSPVMRSIVVGVDPGPSGSAAIEWALREAVSTGAALQAVRAWTPSTYTMEAYMYASGEV